jgi:mRNA-degrading endonuclease toxin of MazEF toxin-antitoxin module
MGGKAVMLLRERTRRRAREGGLPRASMAKCEQVTALRRDRRPLSGALSNARMVEVEKAILRAIGVPVG